LPTSTCSFRKWSPETEQTLRDCFEDTDWDVLQGLHSGNIEEVVDRTTDYINFCMDVVVPSDTTEGDVGIVNQLNNFFNRFDHPNSFTPQYTAPPTPASAFYLPPGKNCSTEKENVPPPTITAARVVLRTDSDGVSPRLLKACALELGDPLQRIFNLSLEHERVPRWCKTSCIIPVPKKPHPGEVNDLHDAFNTIQPLLLRDNLTEMGVSSHLVAWITDYLIGRPQYLRLGDCRSDTVSCHMQKFMDDTAIMGCIRSGQEEEYGKLIQDFVAWCDFNHLHQRPERWWWTSGSPGLNRSL
ncbi:hypothetical protein QTP86_020145, partial [Hemibagrus guttatus]